MFWCRCGFAARRKFDFKKHLASAASVSHYEVSEDRFIKD